MCIAADSGIDHAMALGRVPELVVGDLDSASEDGLAWAAEMGARIDRHPADKDETDLELAMVAAVSTRPTRVVVAAIGGGRFDHLIANIAVLTDRRYDVDNVQIDALVDTSLLSVVHRTRVLRGEIGEPVSLLPMHGDAGGVTTTGFGFPLSGERLRSGSSRGVSNYFASEAGTVTVESGTLLAIQPERLVRSVGGESGSGGAS